MDKSLSSQEIDRLFIQGDRHLQQGNYQEAIAIFERLLTTVEPSHQLYFTIQRNLVKAYQKSNLTERAIALCQTMIDGNNHAISLWGINFMASLAPQIYQEIIQTQANSAEIAATESKLLIPIKQKTLSEFKQYCQDNLLVSLKQFEKERQQTLLTVVISGIISLIVPWL